MVLTDKKIRVLIVDDDEDDYFITRDYISYISQMKIETDWCYRYDDALQRIALKGYDIYLVDYRLGIKTGLDLLKEAIRNGCEEPIVLLTGKGNHEVDREAMEVGALDYLVKTELNTEKLERCIRYALERSNTIKALRTSEQKYRSIFERSKDAVFIAAQDMCFRDINLATCELLGYSREELLTMDLYQLVSDAAQRQLLQEHFAERGEIDDQEIELLTRSNERLPCILSASVVTDKASGYVQGIIHDITDLKKAEKATLQAEKLAATGRLIRTLAHEVRNPLNNINMSVDQLLQEGEKENALLYLDIIKRNANRINDLIRELLASSRPTELVLEKVALQSVLDDSIADAIDRITLKRINLKIRYANEPAYINADRNKLKIAFLNIIINAVEAMPEHKGELTITISTRGHEHITYIADNGCGIAPENLSKLFEPYFTSKRNGMGLGLAATLTIFQSHKASVDVQSKVNEGTTFVVTFPN